MHSPVELLLVGVSPDVGPATHRTAVIRRHAEGFQSAGTQHARPVGLTPRSAGGCRSVCCQTASATTTAASPAPARSPMPEGRCAGFILHRAPREEVN